MCPKGPYAVEVVAVLTAGGQKAPSQLGCTHVRAPLLTVYSVAFNILFFLQSSMQSEHRRKFGKSLILKMFSLGLGQSEAVKGLTITSKCMYFLLLEHLLEPILLKFRSF